MLMSRHEGVSFHVMSIYQYKYVTLRIHFEPGKSLSSNVHDNRLKQILYTWNRLPANQSGNFLLKDSK